ncbi:BTB/POZ domain-containing protein 6-B-like [Gigantopelta aegis]|uniref:BTB/POZ domain-containing protein 6-B-like n=1 Tax=Gigantopelta aegis TaxID=1735272 RepID=UPI001B88A633|nr:BTB/POZ domain-containing protein 6-B-like [Gigantopelta aegis]
MATCETNSQTEAGLEAWQSRTSLTECIRHSLDNKVFNDVTFRVGREQKHVQAHRLILGIRSGVFEAMFYGPLAEQDDIVIPEVESGIFEQFLRYLYTDDVTMNGASYFEFLQLESKLQVKRMQAVGKVNVTCLFISAFVKKVSSRKVGWENGS